MRPVRNHTPEVLAFSVITDKLGETNPVPCWAQVYGSGVNFVNGCKRKKFNPLSHSPLIPEDRLREQRTETEGASNTLSSAINLLA